jgi:hypothetical protein
MAPQSHLGRVASRTLDQSPLDRLTNFALPVMPRKNVAVPPHAKPVGGQIVTEPRDLVDVTPAVREENKRPGVIS